MFSAAPSYSADRSARLKSLFVPILALSLLLVIIVPIPSWLLDQLIVFSLVLSLIIFLRALSLDEPQRLDSFPTLLLLTILFRLALNVSSTRLILLKGQEQELQAAGSVIASFGQFVVQGDFVVGCVIFLLIALVNLLVIAKGSARVAEVAARFVLDALPGKQLAIDADLRAGMLTPEEARQRRSDLSRESQFFGSMDGAMKFVQGDAFAGLAIVLINGLGGIAVGYSKGMELPAALKIFGVLAIGDGLVNIIPSLVLSLAAGVVVTAVSRRDSRGGASSALARQLFGDTRSVFLAGVCLLVLSLIPNLPLIPFFFSGALLLGLAVYSVYRRRLSQSYLEAGSLLILGELEPEPRALEGPGLRFSQNRLEQEIQGSSSEFRQVELCLDESLLGELFLTSARGPDPSIHTLELMLKEFAQDFEAVYGFTLPQISVKLERAKDPAVYRLMLREQIVREGRLKAELSFCLTASSTLAVLGIRPVQSAQHPVDLRMGHWAKLDAGQAKALQRLNVSTLTAVEFMLADCADAVLQNFEQVLGIDEVRNLVERLRERHKFLVEEVFDRALLSYPELTELLGLFVREGISIRDLKLILEGIARFAGKSGLPKDRSLWLSACYEYLRNYLNRAVVASSRELGGKFRVFLLSAELEEEFRAIAEEWEGPSNRPPLELEFELNLRANARKLFNPITERGHAPINILVAEDIRAVVAEFFLRHFRGVTAVRVFSYADLSSVRYLESVGALSVNG